MNSSFFCAQKEILYLIVGCIVIVFISSMILYQTAENSVMIENETYFLGSISQITNGILFTWPCDSNYRITSKFGKRKAPTSGASTVHSGIDIAAATGTDLIACFDGKVIFTGFKGAGGYTITIQNGRYQASYCHVSPMYCVSIGEIVKQGSKIGNVGPKNVYGVAKNPYKDSSGNPTNGATTGPHLHFTLKIDQVAVDPLAYLQFEP